MKGVLKGALAGGVGAAAMFASTAAIAGTGVGGVFNLGQSNSVDAPTDLTGTTPDPQLRVTNDSANKNSTALTLKTPSSRPPLKVSSQTQVANLNADRVDAFHANQLARVGSGDEINNGSILSFASQNTVDISAPKDGLVLVNGSLYAEANNAATCAPCFAHMRLTELGLNKGTDVAVAHLRPAATGNKFDDATLSRTWVVPAAAGDHTYSIDAATSLGSGPLAFKNAEITALWVPFDATGVQGGGR